jgi:hypothetical protein
LKLLVKCFAGCSHSAIIDGLRARGISPERPAQEIAAALACGRGDCQCGRWPHGNVHCPAHDDARPSLSLKDSSGAQPAPGVTLVEVAAAKGLPADFLSELGWQNARWVGRPAVAIPYSDVDGTTLYRRYRIRLNGPDHYRSPKGSKAAPYGLNRLATKARAILVEGETDTATLWYAGLSALGIPGAGNWREAWRVHLQGIEVYLWREPDEGGDAFVTRVVLDLPDVRVIDAPRGVKDPNSLWLELGEDRDHFRREMERLMASARVASDIRAEALSEEARQAFKQARRLLGSDTLLEQVGTAIRELGHAGDLKPPLLTYLAITSRLLPRPLNLAFVAPSAAGKNASIDRPLRLFPKSAYYIEKAGSARALIYDDDGDFQNRTVIVSEADSIPEEGPAASAVRALAEDNCMRYDVVERDPETQKFKTRHIEKPGPTGLITTSTKPLRLQMDTRVLTVSIPDTPTQTRAVLASHASAVNGDTSEPDLSAFVALQRWLELASDRDVTIPFAHRLAEAVPVEQVRMRRDFRQLLTAIQAGALLHQRHRERDHRGRIVATVEDYALARDLLLDVFTAAATGGVSRTVREAAEAVDLLYVADDPVTVKHVGDHLGLAKDTAWHRVRRAVSLGYIRNLETRKGQPARLVPGDPLPEERPALPPAEQVGGGYLAEDDSTVQPDDEPPIGDQSEAAVENAVEQGIQPFVQPPTQGVLDMESGCIGEPVECECGRYPYLGR